ncbi:MAG: hypothetical protein KJ970_13740 [Candidatus Eisenbacteria bacterium]|uniref:HNH endonuclease n=1 Tax=Eiseniibacteriota bacterium TaxID=2212470 RepID=A0A948RZE6_UNCEI|nr:hypothetical protein [Candidatus Eisenbacteria bacterium]MBU1949796.1 hypothetical protein [Candidatus Eisenbacteria bacterium]MBU2691977.1 hypothetical protein [Candidatus Eisenbacteria bacterium]
MAKTLKSVKGLSIVVTGKCWIQRDELFTLIRKRGGKTRYTNTVRGKDDLLVRGGTSSGYAYGTYGLKEHAAAQLIRGGNEIAVIDDYEFRKVVEDEKPGRFANTVAGQPIEWLRPPKDSKSYEKGCKISGPLDREYTSKGRLEQGYLRSHLFRNKEKDTCALCGRLFPLELLIAAHIKPRNECSLRERRDAEHIVFPLCLLGCDSLYERGLVSVNTNGIVVMTTIEEMTRSVSIFLKKLSGRKCRSWKLETSAYFRWHFDRRFRG